VKIRATAFLLAAGISVASVARENSVADAKPAVCQEQPTWAESLLRARASWKSAALSGPERATNLFNICEAIKADFPVSWDWALQDSGGRFSRWFDTDTSTEWERRLIARVLDELAGRGESLRSEYDTLCQKQASPSDARWWDLYIRACGQRRALRFKTLEAKAPRLVFTKRRTIHPSFFAYTEGQSDAQHERHFDPDSALCMLDIPSARPASFGRAREAQSFNVRTLLADPTGVIRDPAVSWDSARVLFAWKKSLDEDDYHLYELTVASGEIRQITGGLGFAELRTGLPAQRPHRLRLDAVRADCGLLVDRSQQPLHVRSGWPVFAPARFRPGAHGVSASARRWPGDLYALGLQ